MNQGELSSFNRLLHSHRLSRCRTSWASSCGLSVAPIKKWGIDMIGSEPVIPYDSYNMCSLGSWKWEAWFMAWWTSTYIHLHPLTGDFSQGAKSLLERQKPPLPMLLVTAARWSSTRLGRHSIVTGLLSIFRDIFWMVLAEYHHFFLPMRGWVKTLYPW